MSEICFIWKGDTPVVAKIGSDGERMQITQKEQDLFLKSHKPPVVPDRQYMFDLMPVTFYRDEENIYEADEVERMQSDIEEQEIGTKFIFVGILSELKVLYTRHNKPYQRISITDRHHDNKSYLLFDPLDLVKEGRYLFSGHMVYDEYYKQKVMKVTGAKKLKVRI